MFRIFHYEEAEAHLHLVFQLLKLVRKEKKEARADCEPENPGRPHPPPGAGKTGQSRHAGFGAAPQVSGQAHGKAVL